MKPRISIFLFSFIGAALMACNSSHHATPTEITHAQHQTPQPQSTAPALPAHFKDAASIPKPLPPTLSPDQFQNVEVKRAYQVAKEIPETLAQLPCFCRCDLGFGHKSLHSCYENNHSSECDICMNEALDAYKMQKEQKMSVEQVREKIIAQYTKAH